MGIWIASLVVASPIVLGLNHRPEEAPEYECRFYNPLFSILSSIISFIIPCCLVLFVYARIMLALRRREAAAKQRRAASQAAAASGGGLGTGKGVGGVGLNGERREAGEIVAGPGRRLFRIAEQFRGKIQSKLG